MALIDSLKVNGSTASSLVREALVSADIDMSTSQVSQLTMKFSDVGWPLLSSGLFNKGNSVDLPGFPMLVSAIDTTEVGGAAGFSIDCRPRSVQALKYRRGARVMANVSPSEFVISECKAVGVSYVVQPSARRTQVARDVPQPGQQETTTPPSSWTTFSRLANEEGFIIFEAAGTIYFGRPSYFISIATENVFVTYGAGETDPWKAMGLPDCHSSLDDTAVTVSAELAGSQGPLVRCPKRLVLGGMSIFNGAYMITNVGLDAMNDSSNVSVSAGTPIDPHPNPPTE